MNHSCYLCSQPMTFWLEMPIDAKKFTPIQYSSAFRCSACGFGAILPRPLEEEISDAYQLSSYYTHGRSHFSSAGRVTFLDRLRVHLAWRLDFGTLITPEVLHRLLSEKYSDICDIGCGNGSMAAALSNFGHRVTGVEVDLHAAEQAMQRGVQLFQGTAERLPEAVSNKKFDMVLMSHVLEHTIDPVAAVRNATQLLRSGGRFVCEVPNCAAISLEHSGLAWEPLDIPRHLNFFVPENLRTLCERNG